MEFSDIYKILPSFERTDFIVGKDSFEDIQIEEGVPTNGFWYFKNTKKGLIKRFVLHRGPQAEKVCVVTLIKKPNGKFTPRFDFQIWNTTKKAIDSFSNERVAENLIKAKVSLDNCYENFSLLIDCIKNIQKIDFISSSYVMIEKEKKELFENITKDIAIKEFNKKYGNDITDKDISLLQDRRSKLEHFEKLLTDESFFESERKNLEKETETKEKKTEDVWQYFFEKNPWIFGYGLQLIACEGLDDEKLEKTVVGSDIIDGPGKRIDALLKTKGNISKMLFCEIKTHKPNILIENYDRPGVYVPAKELRGAVAQIQKTIHKVTLKFQKNYHRVTEKSGDPTGEEVLFVKPRGVVVIGKLDDFKTEGGINYEKLSSFELYRQQVSGIEIMTFDELYQRVKFIVEK
ncbi:Shedu immune nuclease family protein [Patescibacteria group bacterium]